MMEMTQELFNEINSGYSDDEDDGGKVDEVPKTIPKTLKNPNPEPSGATPARSNTLNTKH